MENLPKDIIEKITNELSFIDFISFDKAYCEKFSDDFWLRRIKLDGFDKILSKADLNAKRKYLGLIQKISKSADKMTSNILGLYEDFQHFLTNEYKEKVRKLCYDYIIKCLDASIHEISINNTETLSDFITNFTYEYLRQFNHLFPTKMFTCDFIDVCADILNSSITGNLMFYCLGFKLEGF